MEWRKYNNYLISSTGEIKSLITNKIMKQYVSNVGYPAVRLTLEPKKTKLFHVHQLIAIVYLDYFAESGLVVDHINNIKTDNRLENLQIISRRLNNTKELTGKIKYPGVQQDKGRRHYRARIKIDGKYKSLGSFLSQEAAYAAYMRALKTVDLQAYKYYKHNIK